MRLRDHHLALTQRQIYLLEELWEVGGRRLLLLLEEGVVVEGLAEEPEAALSQAFRTDPRSQAHSLH